MAADLIVFTVPGAAKAFARAGSNGGQRFTPAAQRNFANLVKMAGEAAMAGRPPISQTCALRVTVRRPIPASARKRDRAPMLAGEILPHQRPDLDNHVKIVGDALNGICWADDALIAKLSVEKIYAEIPGLEVAVWPVGRPA
jgi:Holliday junction resolvase RusA-like endonuclease